MNSKISTKNKIVTAMIQLMKKDAFKDITVKQLITETSLNRSSFYYHFNNTEEVADFIVSNFISNYFSSMKPSFDSCDFMSIDEFHLDTWERAIEYLYSQKELLIILMKPDYISRVFHYLKIHQTNSTHAMELYYVLYSANTPSTSPQKLFPGLLQDHFIYKSTIDLVGVFNYLVYRNFPDSPKKIAKILYTSFNLNIVECHKSFDFDKNY